MKFTQFLEYRYQEVVLDSQGKDYDAFKDSETKALQSILASYRSILKAAMVPKCLYDYARVVLGKREEPKPALVLKAKEDRDKMEKASLEQQVGLKVVSE